MILTQKNCESNNHKESLLFFRLAQSATTSFTGNCSREGPSMTILKSESRVFSFLVHVLITLSCENVLSTSAVCIGTTLQILPCILMLGKIAIVA